MRALLSPLSHAWRFCRSQQLLHHAAAVLLLPAFLMSGIAQEILRSGDVQSDQRLLFLTLIILLISLLLSVWGEGCVLLVGQRLLSPHAPRPCASLQILLTAARPLMLPLLLTSVLRQCLILLWGLLLIIPGLLYAIRTTLFQVVIVTEGLAYRPALQRSAHLIEGKTLQTFFFVLFLSLLSILPTALREGLTLFVPPFSPLRETWSILNHLFESLLLTIASVFTLLARVAYYRDLREEKVPPLQHQLHS